MNFIKFHFLLPKLNQHYKEHKNQRKIKHTQKQRNTQETMKERRFYQGHSKIKKKSCLPTSFGISWIWMDGWMERGIKLRIKYTKNRWIYFKFFDLEIFG